MFNINPSNIETLDQLNIQLDNYRSYYYKIYNFNIDYQINDILSCNHNIIYDPKIGFRYFCYRYLDIIRTFQLPIIQENNIYEAVLIEYRKLPHLEFLLRNAIYKLGGKYWSFSVICGIDNYDYMVDLCSTISTSINVIKTNVNNLNQSSYSDLLSCKYFWNLLHGEKILIYQEDSCIFRNNIDNYLQFDYIGAPWPLTQNDNSYNVGNGGFSLRTRKIMLEIIDKIDINDTQYNQSTLEYIREWDFIFKDFNPNFFIPELWINISPPGAYQEIHHHILSPTTGFSPYPLFSGVFYIDVKENSGDLVLKSPTSQNLNNIPLTPKHKNKFNITPKNQNLILFPSFLEHLVSQNKSNQDRISISFNIKYTTT